MATQKQQGIKKRLTKGFTKVAVIGAVAAIIGIGALLIAAAQYEKALNRYGFTQGDIGKAMTAFSESRSALRAVVGYDDEAVIEKQTALHDQKKEAFETYMDELSRTLKFSEGREAYNAVLTELDGYWDGVSNGRSTESESGKAGTVYQLVFLWMGHSPDTD